MNVNRLVHNGAILPFGWRRAKLGEVCRVIGGSTPDTSNPSFWDGNIVWITPSDLGKLKDRWIKTSGRKISDKGYKDSGIEMLPSGAVVLSSRAPIGYLGIATVGLCTNQGCKSFIPSDEIDGQFLYWELKYSVPALKERGSGATFSEVSKSALEAFEISFPPLAEQKRIAEILNRQMAVIEKARAAAEAQLEAAKALQFGYVQEVSSNGKTASARLEDCLVEVTNGVGKDWKEYAVLGATRNGLSLAKEQPGKHPEKYKYVSEGTIFYNPMRILLGSIACVDNKDDEGITSPDYVAFKTKTGILHHLWFYHWLRSPLGDRLIRSLARGAVRERMLFNRLSKGLVELPGWEAQTGAAEKIRAVKPLIERIKAQLSEINSLPAALLKRALNGEL